jgi:hypothetical protein
MVEYKCTRCQKVFNKKSHFNDHNLRKIKCKIITDTKNAENNLQKAENNLQKAEILKCDMCNKVLSTKYTLSRHKKNCKQSPKTINNESNDELKKLYQELLKQMQKQNIKIYKLENENKKIKEKLSKTKLNNITNNNTTTNNTTNNNTINQYINILPFGEEKLDHLTKNDWRKLLLSWNDSIQRLIKQIHYNENVPQNCNVYIPTLKNNYAMIFTGKQWDLKPMNDIVDRLIDDKSNELIEKFDELDKTDKENKYYENYSEKCVDENFLKDVKKEVKLLLYNEKEIPLTIIKNNNEIIKSK